MKDQASLNLKIVDSPIDSKALEGHLMLRATSDGLKLYDNTGVETPIGGEVDESRLLPTGGKNGDILGYQEGVDRGNGADVRLLLQNALTDSANGNAAPAAVTTQGVTLTGDNNLLFDGNDSHVTAVLPTDEIFAADKEWTIDGWIKPVTISDDWSYILTENRGDWGSHSIGLTWNSDKNVLEQDTGGYVASVIKSPNWPNDSVPCAADQWHFIAVEKQKTASGWNLNYYLNGAIWLQVAFTGDFVPFDSGNPFWFGGRTDDRRWFKGEANKLRVTAGARYGGKAFAVPDRLTDYATPAGQPVWTEGFDRSRLLPENPADGDIPCYNATATIGGGNDANTKILLHFDADEIKDEAAGNAAPVTITKKSGTITVVEGGKWGKCAKYVTGSMTVATNLDELNANNWVVSGWFNPDADDHNVSYPFWLSMDDQNTHGFGFDSTGRYGESDGPLFYMDTPPAAGTWHWLAIVKYSGGLRFYLNGAFLNEISAQQRANFCSTLAIGGFAGTYAAGSRERTFSGLVDEVRLQYIPDNEIGQWTGTSIAVPDAPYSKPQVVGEWSKLNKSALVQSVNGQTPDSSGAVTLPSATALAAGLMAAADKAKLDKFGESDGKLTYGGAEIGGGGISEIAVGTGLSGTGITSDPLNLNIANYTSQSTISLSSTEGSVNLAGHNSVNLQETFGNKLTLAERGVVITTASGADVLLNEHASNSPSGFVILDNTGKLPAVDGSQLTNLPTGGSVDLSDYTGGIKLNSTNDSAVAIKFNSGNPTYNAALTMDAAGVTLSGYGDVTLSHTGGSYLRLTSGEATLSSNSSLSLRASSRLTIYATEGIYLGGAGFNTAGGLVTVGEDGKISSSLYNAGSSGATPPLLLTCPTSSTAVHLEITAGKLADGSDNATLINTSTSAEHRAKVYGNSGNTDWIECPETGFGTNFNGWPIRVDVTDLLDPSEISYIRYRWVSTTGDASDWYAMVYPCATEAPVASGSGSGGDTSALEKRVTTLETTVGTLNASVDEILADYGEGSGALVYRVVASATEPENPTEGMIWIQTE